MPPAVQTTVFRATALIPGVNVGKAADALGRAALAVSGAGLAGVFGAAARCTWRPRPYRAVMNRGFHSSPDRRLRRALGALIG